MSKYLLLAMSVILAIFQSTHSQVLTLSPESLRSDGIQPNSRDLVLKFSIQTNTSMVSYTLGLVDASQKNGMEAVRFSLIKEYLDTISPSKNPVVILPRTLFEETLAEITFNYTSLDENSIEYSGSDLTIKFENASSPMSFQLLSQYQKMANFSLSGTPLNFNSTFDFQYKFVFPTNSLFTKRDWTFSLALGNSNPVSRRVAEASFSLQPPLVQNDTNLTWRFRASDGFDTFEETGRVLVLTVSQDNALNALSNISSGITADSLSTTGTILSGILDMTKSSTCQALDLTSQRFINNGACQINSDCCNGGTCRKNQQSKGSCNCSEGFMGLRCELSRQVTSVNILDTVKEISQNIKKLINSTSAMTLETAENAVFSLESVVRVADRQVMDDTLTSLQMVAKQIRSPEALKSIVKTMQAVDVNLDLAVTNQTLLQQNQIQMQNTIKDALAGVATGLSSGIREKTIQIGESLKAVFKLADNTNKVPSISVSDEVQAAFNLTTLLGDQSKKIATVVYNFPKSNLRSFKHADTIEGDVFDFTSVDISDPSKPIYPKFSGDQEILRFNVKVPNVASSQGVSCTFFNQTSQKFEFTSSSSENGVFTCKYSHNSVYAVTRYNKVSRSIKDYSFSGRLAFGYVLVMILCIFSMI